MSNAQYTVSESAGSKVVTAFVNGEVLTANESNPNFGRIVERLFEGDTHEIGILFNAEVAVMGRFKELSDRVAVRNGQVFFDGDPIENDLSDHLMRTVRDGADVGPLVKFWELIAANPTEHSRENLLRWLRATNGFTITSEGMLIGYRGTDSNLKSKHSGPGIINGVEINGQHDNSPGNVVAMARSQVNHDPSNGCSIGLHVGTWDYASSWGQRVVEVLINPRDVVSVPTDCDGQKMRVCRFKVLREVESKRESAVTHEVTAEDHDDVTDTVF